MEHDIAHDLLSIAEGKLRPVVREKAIRWLVMALSCPRQVPAPCVGVNGEQKQIICRYRGTHMYCTLEHFPGPLFTPPPSLSRSRCLMFSCLLSLRVPAAFRGALSSSPDLYPGCSVCPLIGEHRPLFLSLQLSWGSSGPLMNHSSAVASSWYPGSSPSS